MFDNTQGTLESVPAILRDFYQIELRSELTGNQVEEEYTYLDENNDTQTGTRLVDEYHDVSYIVMKLRHDLKSWNFVEKVSNTNPEFKAYCIEKASEAEYWQFHDRYLEWLTQEPNPDDEKYLELDADDNPICDYNAESEQWQSLEPAYTATDTSVYLMQVAKSARDTGRYAPIAVDGLTYDATQEAYDNLQGMVSSWEIMIADQTLIDAGLVVDGQMYWTLADNSNTLVTKETLQAVVTAIRVRAGLLHAQYQSDKSTVEA